MDSPAVFFPAALLSSSGLCAQRKKPKIHLMKKKMSAHLTFHWFNNSQFWYLPRCSLQTLRSRLTWRQIESERFAEHNRGLLLNYKIQFLITLSINQIFFLFLFSFFWLLTEMKKIYITWKCFRRARLFFYNLNFRMAIRTGSGCFEFVFYDCWFKRRILIQNIALYRSSVLASHRHKNRSRKLWYIRNNMIKIFNRIMFTDGPAYDFLLLFYNMINSRNDCFSTDMQKGINSLTTRKNNFWRYHVIKLYVCISIRQNHLIYTRIENAFTI